MRRKNNIDGISIKCFVSNYLGTYHECSKLKHQGLKSFDNPYVVGVSNDFALKNPDCVARQELLIVIDDYGNPGTYINPVNIQKLIEIETCKEKLKMLEGISCHSFEEAFYLYQVCNKLVKDIEYLEVLYGGTYELLYLLNKFKLLRRIKKRAKEIAKETLIFTAIKSNVDKEINDYNYDEYENFDETTDASNIIILDVNDDYHITEKVNRQKCLNYKSR